MQVLDHAEAFARIETCAIGGIYGSRHMQSARHVLSEFETDMQLLAKQIHLTVDPEVEARQMEAIAKFKKNAQKLEVRAYNLIACICLSLVEID